MSVLSLGDIFLGFVLVSFPFSVTKYPDESNLRCEGLILLTVQGYTPWNSPSWWGGGGSRQLEAEAVGQIALTVKKKSKMNTREGSAQFLQFIHSKIFCLENNSLLVDSHISTHNQDYLPQACVYLSPR